MGDNLYKSLEMLKECKQTASETNGILNKTREYMKNILGLGDDIIVEIVAESFFFEYT